MLLQSLAAAVASPEPDSQPVGDLEAEVSQKFTSIIDDYLQLREERKASGSQASSSHVPAFFKSKASKDSVSSRIAQEARARKEQFQGALVLNEEELRSTWYLLESYSVAEGEQLKINYDGFTQVATRCRQMFGTHIDTFFRATVFLRFEQDRNGCISTQLFFNYLQLRAHMHSMRLLLAKSDTENTGSLTVQQLEEFIGQSVASVPGMQEVVDTPFFTYYKRIGTRKFLLFHGKGGSIKIKDLVNSPVLQELMEFRSGALQEHQLLQNWFSLQSARRVYNTFQALDEDMNNMLSRSEFSHISNGTMSAFFINRIFEEHVMQRRSMLGRKVVKDEMDIVAFTDFVLAWDHRSHPAAIKYFFDIFDLQNKPTVRKHSADNSCELERAQGMITPVEIYTFFREIYKMWVAMGEYADLAIYDVVDEIIDMVQARDTLGITPEDLAKCQMSGTFFSMLADVRQFYDYNYRENLMHQDDDN